MNLQFKNLQAEIWHLDPPTYLTSIRQRQSKYSAIFTEPEVNNCFSIIFKGEFEKENLAKHEEQMSLSLAITPRNPIITVHTVIMMQNCYIHLWKLY